MHGLKMGLNGFVFGKIPGRIFKFPLILRCLHKVKMGSFGNFIFCVEARGQRIVSKIEMHPDWFGRGTEMPFFRPSQRDSARFTLLTRR